MSIISYLAQTHRGKKESLKQKLSQIKGCEYLEPESSEDEILIIITETNSTQEDEIRNQEISALPEVKNLTMVYGQALQQQETTEGVN